MPDGSSSEAPVISPGPSILREALGRIRLPFQHVFEGATRFRGAGMEPGGMDGIVSILRSLSRHRVLTGQGNSGPASFHANGIPHLPDRGAEGGEPSVAWLICWSLWLSTA